MARSRSFVAGCSIPERRSGDVRLDRHAKCQTGLPRIDAADRTAQRELCAATFLPRASQSKHSPATSLHIATRRLVAVSRLGRMGCGRLPYRKDVRMASHSLRKVSANPLPLRRLPPDARHGFINEFSAAAGNREHGASIPWSQLRPTMRWKALAPFRPARGNDQEIRE